MVVVRCLILCSKFAKNRSLGKLQHSPILSNWIMGEGKIKGRWKGRRGREEGGKKSKDGGGVRGKGRGKEGVSAQIKMVKALL